MNVSAMIADTYRTIGVLRTCALSLENDTGSFEVDGPSIRDTVHIAADMVGSLLDRLEAIERSSGQANQPSTISILFEQWKAVRASQMALAASLMASQDNPPELDLLENQTEDLCQQIANSIPQTDADAAAMLEWSLDDSDGAILSDLYIKAHRSVADYLSGKGQHLKAA